MKTKVQLIPADYRKLSDEELIHRFIHRQDHTAVILLFERYGHLVFGLSLKYLKNAVAAKEAAEQVFIRLLTGVNEWDGGSFKNWLSGVTEQHCNTGSGYDGRLSQSEASLEIESGSACLSRRQVKEYVNEKMSEEERPAAEQHLAGCLFCSGAFEGLSKNRSAILTLEHLGSGFLKDHFSLTHPHVHLNSLAPSAATASVPQRRGRHQSAAALLITPGGAVSAVILAVAVLWYLQFLRSSPDDQPTQRAAADKAFARGMLSPAAPSAARQAVPSETPAPAAQNAVIIQASAPQHITTAPSQEIPAGKRSSNSEAQELMPQPAALPDVSSSSASMPEGDAPKRSSSVLGSLFSGKTSGDETSEQNASPTEPAASAAPSADELYDSGSYNAALRSYKKQMTATDPRSRQEATLQAARCYINLGQSANAARLLAPLAAEGSGAPKRQARRILRSMNATRAE